MSRLLNDTAQALLADERALLLDLRDAQQRYGASAADQAALDGAIAHLDELFLLVVVGEFNAGKSAVLNVLIGVDVLPEGVTPTTSRITIVRYDEQVAGPRLTEAGFAEVTAPVELLRDLHVVDTPGTNAIVREHEALTREFVPRSDLVLFITSADRPFTESERAFLESIRDWGKKVVIVINKVDILDGEAQLETVVTFVKENARALLGLSPAIFPVSAKLAAQGRRTENPAAVTTSGFPALEQYLWTALDRVERLRLKLLNPLGVGEHVAEGLAADVAGRLELLREDVDVLGQLDRQLGIYEEDLRREFEFRMADVEKTLVEMERRGHDHFDDTIRLGRVMDLLDKGRMQEQFEKQVVADTPQQIERKVDELIDWLVGAEFRHWQIVNEHLAERRAAHRERLASLPQAGRFHHDRARLIDSVGRETERIVETYDRAREAADIASKARGAVAASAALQVGALGLGAVVAAVASTAAADMTGLVMAGLVATLGLLIIPHRRRQAKQELRDKVTGLRERLGRALREAFETEVKGSVARVREHIEPYSRFVRAEQQHLTAAQAQLKDLRRRMDAMRGEILAR